MKEENNGDEWCDESQPALPYLCSFTVATTLKRKSVCVKSLKAYYLLSEIVIL